MLVISLRTLIIYLTLIVVMRFMGKRQIGEMQPFEFVITLIIADLACVPMADVSIPLLYGIVSILVLFLLHQLISLIEQSGDFAKRLVSGKPSVVITREGTRGRAVFQDVQRRVARSLDRIAARVHAHSSAAVLGARHTNLLAHSSILANSLRSLYVSV